MGRPKLARPNYQLKQASNGIWTICWSEDRKPRSCSTGTRDEAEARAFRDRWRAALEAPIIPDVVTIGAILDHYLSHKKDKATHDDIRLAIVRIKRHLGNLIPDDLGRNTWWDARRKDGVGDNTIIKEGSILRAALAMAVADRLIQAPPPKVDFPQKPPGRSRWLTREEAAKLIAACKTPHTRLFVLLALHTGARAGAILDLTWDRVDFGAGLITLALPTRQQAKKRRATVPMSATLRHELLEAQKAAITGHVIEYRGHRLDRMITAFNDTVKRAGIAHCTPHDLRRTAATWMVQAGIPTAKVARYLGDTEAMIERVYGRHSPGYLKDAADALDAQFAAKDMLGSLLGSPPESGGSRGNKSVAE